MVSGYQLEVYRISGRQRTGQTTSRPVCSCISLLSLYTKETWYHLCTWLRHTWVANECKYTCSTFVSFFTILSVLVYNLFLDREHDVCYLIN